MAIRFHPTMETPESVLLQRALTDHAALNRLEIWATRGLWRAQWNMAVIYSHGSETAGEFLPEAIRWLNALVDNAAAPEEARASARLKRSCLSSRLSLTEEMLLLVRRIFDQTGEPLMNRLALAMANTR